MEKNNIISGIKAYDYEQRILLRAMRDNGLSQHRFDRLFGDESTKILPTGETVFVRKRPKLRFLSSDNKAFILGDVFSMGNWSKWLHLLQLMILSEIVIIEEKQGVILRIKKRSAQDNPYRAFRMVRYFIMLSYFSWACVGLNPDATRYNIPQRRQISPDNSYPLLMSMDFISAVRFLPSNVLQFGQYFINMLHPLFAPVF
jgi:hypothetical protein